MNSSWVKSLGSLIGAFLPLWPTYLLPTTIARSWSFKLGLSVRPHLGVDPAPDLVAKVEGLLGQGSILVEYAGRA